MILADTSVWIDHFREANPEFMQLLVDGQIAIHPFVIGELACGTLARREEVLWMLSQLPRLPEARHDEAMALIEQRRLAGQGLGWVDMHLLAAALLAGAQLWTKDKRLRSVAESFETARFAKN